MKFGLKKYWKSMKPYLEKAHIVRYEKLIAAPDLVQSELGERFHLTFRKPFSSWPEGFEIAEYWLKTGLSTQGLKPARDWRASPKDIERVQRIEQTPGFRECCEVLGYSSNLVSIGPLRQLKKPRVLGRSGTSSLAVGCLKISIQDRCGRSNLPSYWP
jgi:hypothetical protein